MLPPTLTLCPSSSSQPGHRTVGFAVWVLPATPGQPERVESLPEKRRELGAHLPMDSTKEICQNVHIPPPRHSSCHILVMPWQLYSPIVLYGPKDQESRQHYLSGPATCHPHVIICPWPQDMGNSTSPHPSPCSSSWQVEVLTPSLCRLLLCPQ